jgi:RimJ/RimL family protein N-acetyltransferase
VTSDDIRLRDVTDSDIGTFFEDQQDPEGVAMAAFASRNADEHAAHWRRIRADDTVMLKAVLYRGEVAGNVVSWLNGDERAVGYWIGRAFWGNGVASRALASFVNEVGERPLFGYVARHNAASVRVLEKCGFEMVRTRQEPGDVEELVYVLRD